MRYLIDNENRIIIGEIQDDNFNGFGKKSFPSGGIFEGYFKEGNRVKGKHKCFNG